MALRADVCFRVYTGRLIAERRYVDVSGAEMQGSGVRLERRHGFRPGAAGRGDSLPPPMEALP